MMLYLLRVSLLLYQTLRPARGPGPARVPGLEKKPPYKLKAAGDEGDKQDVTVSVERATLIR